MTFTQPHELPFSLKPRELAIATAAALGVYVALFGYGFNSNANEEVPVAVAKSDRLALAGENRCAGQAWGSWNQECLSAISNRNNLRLVPSRTIEYRDAERRMTVLLSEPDRS